MFAGILRARCKGFCVRGSDMIVNATLRPKSLQTAATTHAGWPALASVSKTLANIFWLWRPLMHIRRQADFWETIYTS